MEVFALLYAGTSIGAVFAGDFITLLIFWEGMALTSTALVVVYGGKAVNAGFRYLLFHVFGGSMFLAAIAMNYVATGSYALDNVWVSGIPIVFAIIGIGVNLAMIPFHTWLPDTYPRPHIVASVFLSVYTTKAAVYTLARVVLPLQVNIGDPTPYMAILAYMGGLMAIYGVTMAVMQTNMRKLLSYHIVSQVGYMVAGVGMAFPLAVNGGMAHVFNHILYKALLFMAVGAVIYKTQQEEDMSKVGGLWKAMPITTIAFWIAAFSISGVPGFNGFVSKGMVITSAAEGGPGLFGLRILLEAASFGTFLSFLKLGWFVFMKENVNGIKVKIDGDAPLPMKVAMLGTALLCVVIGVYPAVLFNILPVHMEEAYAPYALEHVLETGVVLGLAVAFFFTVGVRVLKPTKSHEIPDLDTGYRAGGRAVMALAEGISSEFGRFYDGVTAAGSGLIAMGRRSMGWEGKDVNWNMVAFGLLVVLLVGAVLLGVT
jgi:multicomponent Na+:H+ antiporter subunit D